MIQKEEKIQEQPKQIVVKRTILFSTKEETISNALIATLLQNRSAYVYWQCRQFIDFGVFDGNQIILNNHPMVWAYIQELRIFGDDFELHFWKRNNKVQYRLILDETQINEKTNDNTNDIEQPICISQKVKLWDTQAEKKGDFVVLTEDRGMHLSLPIVWAQNDKENATIFMKEIRYIQYDEDGMASFVDRRLCGFYVGSEKGMKKCTRIK